MVCKKILVVDDDSGVRNLLHRFFARKNFQVKSAESGNTALEMFEKFNPDLVILDVMLPDIIGFDVCKRIKRKRPDILVMLLTSLTDVQHQLTGLEWADAYISKPFHLEVLEKQVQALLRVLYLPNPAQTQPLVFDNLVINPVSREVTLDNQLVSLTSLEFDLLYFLAKHPQQAWSRSQLIREVWGHEFPGGLRVVDVHIGQLRKKIEPTLNQRIFIQTIQRFGYKFGGRCVGEFTARELA
ncbi:MAG TPA: response regulator transcription factor [Oculatellaceae cyanobacterium]